MSLKTWISGEKINASDLNDNFTNLGGKIKFGGTGADGALTISSGTTTIDLGGERVVIKNYSSISITGTGKLAFTNPASAGTVVILKCSGDVTLTSSQAPMIDLRGIGAAGGGGASKSDSGYANGSNGTGGTVDFSYWADGGAQGGQSTTGGTAGTIAARSSSYPALNQILAGKYPLVFVGAGGGGGAANFTSGSSAGTGTGGNGGRGGGALIIECGGYWNFTTTGGISVSGNAGTNGSATGSRTSGGGGGGGGAGYFLGLYNYLTANTGTITSAGGAAGSPAQDYSGGANIGAGGGGGGGSKSIGDNGVSGSSGAAGAGGVGGAGFSLVAANTEFA